MGYASLEALLRRKCEQSLIVGDDLIVGAGCHDIAVTGATATEAAQHFYLAFLEYKGTTTGRHLSWRQHPTVDNGPLVRIVARLRIGETPG